MTVRQIENLLALLEFFAERREPATLADVVRQFGWPRSSAFNILTTLVENGYLYEPRARGGFYPSPKWMQVISAISEAEPLPEFLARVLRRLAEETGETVWVSAPSGVFAVFLDVVESFQAIRYAAKPGKRVPIHVTASGQALLAQMPRRDMEVILNKVTFNEFGPNAPKSVEEVLQRIDEGRARGWFHSASNYSNDLGGVSVPVTVSGRPFSVTVAGPLSRVQGKELKHATMIQQALAEDTGQN
ncbi:IclR family transcriptional regulator [uncultured Roseibium sp.]|uniref:IclR family transcriptional regulator n=1 Tax=uncultured Roseibium sp. TaxID=1936171 RepID=UPI00321804F1